MIDVDFLTNGCLICGESESIFETEDGFECGCCGMLFDKGGWLLD